MPTDSAIASTPKIQREMTRPCGATSLLVENISSSFLGKSLLLARQVRPTKSTFRGPGDWLNPYLWGNAPMNAGPF